MESNTLLPHGSGTHVLWLLASNSNDLQLLLSCRAVVTHITTSEYMVDFFVRDGDNMRNAEVTSERGDAEKETERPRWLEIIQKLVQGEVERRKSLGFRKS
jgi:hypothetical protein